MVPLWIFYNPRVIYTQLHIILFNLIDTPNNNNNKTNFFFLGVKKKNENKREFYLLTFVT